MAKSTAIKTSTTSTPIVNNSKTLTVVVVNEKSQPVRGANVSITPSNTSGVTNNLGEIQFTLGSATKYNITATADKKTVTVPYYVTQSGSRRLVINPVYIKNIETQLHYPWLNLNLVSTIGIALVIIILLVVIWKLFRRKK